MHLTPQIPEQRVQLEPSEVGCGGQHWARAIGAGRTGQGDGVRIYSKEADEDGAQDKDDHQEDEESGLGVDVCSNQTHKQTQQGDDRAVEQGPPVARR